MNRAGSPPGRRHLLKGAVLAAASSVMLPEPRAGAQTQAPDRPSALWAPAAPANYTVSDRPSPRHPVDLVVIHVTQTSFDKALTIFRNPKKKVSAHYVVRSSDGRIAQCVREADVAWHAGNWEYNTRSIGIEHEGWVDRPAYFTDALYERSAELTATVCDRYGIPKDRAHVIGHHEVPGSDHTDPGRNWDWARYMRLVAQS
ncbi:N-acetylmuramoyl-L-alanine amidase [Streptomyces roseirectus]|uniref:N-acetylmuramoyl-L-alanine amidase n=1 Tax=Streptomyces roseirectus TaxID=2768066 RepID=A0A7H0ITD6_9ACTN|nr:N-acetylmuramoyl-L-alanine amidase [Streptomyces roseirectus]QNP76052.1 N-acetylmuramoyl-L-alanine amidase [Streptomyces roseirectus]